MSFEIRQGDVLDVLRTLPTNQFHGCLCDPPYGLSSSEKRSPQRKSGVEQNRKGFMGLEWDGAVPGPIIWRELLRTLRPGANLLAFGGTRTHHRLMIAIEDAGFEIRDCLMWLHGQGFPKSFDVGNGYGTALKPAWEPIILAMKPCAGNFADNLEKWGVAGLAIEASRIQHNDSIRPFQTPNNILNGGYNRKNNQRFGEPSADRRYTENGSTNFAAKPGPRGGDSSGRWPANVILDEESASDLDERTGPLTSGHFNGHRNEPKTKNVLGTFQLRDESPSRPANSGGASRFYYCAKASAAERAGNNHPTVKPLELTEYLARLILPPKYEEPSRLIVPFSGSGSEMIGALASGWDDVTGIEKESAYVSIAETRLATVAFA